MYSSKWKIRVFCWKHSERFLLYYTWITMYLSKKNNCYFIGNTVKDFSSYFLLFSILFTAKFGRILIVPIYILEKKLTKFSSKMTLSLNSMLSLFCIFLLMLFVYLGVWYLCTLIDSLIDRRFDFI